METFAQIYFPDATIKATTKHFWVIFLNPSLISVKQANQVGVGGTAPMEPIQLNGSISHKSRAKSFFQYLLF